MSITVEPASLVFKDKDGNVGFMRSLTDADLAKIEQGVRVWSGARAYPEGFVVRSGTDLYQAITAVSAGTALTDTTAWRRVLSVSDLAVSATTEIEGLVELATDAEVAAGTTGKIPDAAQVHGLVSALGETVEDLLTVQDEVPSDLGNVQGVITPADNLFDNDAENTIPRTGLAYAIGTLANWYWRGSLFTVDKTTVTIPAGTQVHINGTGYILTSDRALSLDSAGTAAERAGHSVYIYARVPSSGLEPDFVLSLTELTDTAVRKIGGFYCINFAAGSSSSSVLSGYSNGDALPDSRWDLLGHADSGLATNLSIFDLCPDGAAQHNALYRGKDITADFDSGKFSENVANGTFRDIFPGDYIRKDITISGITYSPRWVIGDLDYLYKYYSQDSAGNWSPLGVHHCAIFPDIALGTSYMNATNVTTGGYMGSYMYKTTLPPVCTAIKNLFGSHIVEFWQFLSNTVNASAASRAGAGWVGTVTNNEWVKCVAELMNENMLYGVKFGSSGRDAYDNPHILAAVQHNGLLRFNNLDNTVQNTFWLRDVSSSAHFARAHAHGHASSDAASHVYGVRPFCLIS